MSQEWVIAVVAAAAARIVAMASAWPVRSSHSSHCADTLAEQGRRLAVADARRPSVVDRHAVASSTRKRSGSAAASARYPARTRAWKSSALRLEPVVPGARLVEPVAAGCLVEVEQDVRSGSRPSAAQSDRFAHLVGIEHPARALVGDGRVEVAVLDHDVAALERRAHHVAMWCARSAA